MRHIFIAPISAVVLLTHSTAMAAPASPDPWAGRADGTTWRALDAHGKAIFLKGLLAGILTDQNVMFLTGAVRVTDLEPREMQKYALAHQQEILAFLDSRYKSEATSHLGVGMLVAGYLVEQNKTLKARATETTEARMKLIQQMLPPAP